MRERERMIDVNGRKYKQPINISKSYFLYSSVAVNLKLHQRKRLH